MKLLGYYDWSLIWEHKGELFRGLLVAIEVAAVFPDERPVVGGDEVH